MKPRPLLVINRCLVFCIALCAFCSKSAPAQSVSTVGSPWVLIQTLKGTSAPCGPLKSVAFDGAISPFSYNGTSGQTMVQINASLGDQNFRFLGSLTSQGGLAANYTVDCNNGQSMYNSLKSLDPTSFRWGEWLYGFYRSTTTGYVYATIYNEYYDGNYTPGATTSNGCRTAFPDQCCYSGIGLAKSIDNGKTFSPVQAAPGHVIARAPYLYYSNAGHGMGSAFEGGGTFFCNPNDAYLYRTLNQFKNTVSGDYGVTMMRTRKVDIEQPTSWRAWDGIGYNRSFYPAGTYGETIPLPFGSPFYLGWSAYFHKYIATGVCGPNYCFTLSSDMIHWSAGITIMAIDPQAYAYSGNGIPSLMDPTYLAQTGNGSATNGSIVGQNPYLSFIRHNISQTVQHQVVVQQLNFEGADTTPPVITMTAPLNFAVVSGTTVTVSATASDNVGVVGVQFKVDDGDLGEVTAPVNGLFSTTWNIPAGAAGAHTLIAVARDDYGNTTTTAPVVVSVVVTGTITASPNPCVIPVGGTQCSTFISWTTSPSVPPTWHVQVRVSWDGGLPETLFVCDTTNATGVEAPWIPPGHSVEFGLYYASHMPCDEPGAPFVGALLASVTVTATPAPDTAPPTVAITAPPAGSSVRATLPVGGTASDNVGVAGVQFKLDCPGSSCVNIGSELLNPSTNFTTSWNTSSTANGTHVLTAVARDVAGNTTISLARTVTVDNAAPTAVLITAPANLAQVAGTAVTVSGTASDNIGVLGVQFQLDGASLGELDRVPPYSINWNTTLTANGSHTLTAIARDFAGNTTVSAPRTVTVKNLGRE